MSIDGGMRFNEKELKLLASQQKCKKEGHLFFRECQESFFRKPIESKLFHKNTKIILLYSSANNVCKKYLSYLLVIAYVNIFFVARFTVNNLRWCKLYNNLLFILKTNDQFSEAQQLIVLENVNQISTISENTCAFVIGKYL